MPSEIVIHWFRQDLRVSDNPALSKAALHGPVLPIYILDDQTPGPTEKIGRASRCWLHHSLKALDKTLQGQLRLFQGQPAAIFEKLRAELNIKAIFWNRCYEPWRIQRDKTLKKALQDAGLEVNTFNGSLLWEPWENLKEDGTSYRVFTPFYNKGCLNGGEPRAPLDIPEIDFFREKTRHEHPLSELRLLPKIAWDRSMLSYWKIGESAAQAVLKRFLDNGLNGYKEGRNEPALNHVSRLSPYLHWGEISPNQIWAELKKQKSSKDLEHFRSELAWREFSYSLLFHNPDLPSCNLQAKFDQFPWEKNQDLLKRWQAGQTGYPIVDAGMRELWQTGYMHNRVRMIVGSFLVKNLTLHWHYGQAWFWDTLLDADLANNSASWQWIAGCGADAAPYFRIFNPVLQGEKFDSHGEYTRHFVPELAGLPDKYLFKPWEAPANILEAAGVSLGENYPHPVVELKQSREKALSAYQALSNL